MIPEFVGLLHFCSRSGADILKVENSPLVAVQPPTAVLEVPPLLIFARTHFSPMVEGIALRSGVDGEYGFVDGVHRCIRGRGGAESH